MTLFGEFTFAPPVDDASKSTEEFAALLGERSPEVRDRAVELIGELLAIGDVADAAGHVDVRVLAEPGTVRIEVRDGGPDSCSGACVEAQGPPRVAVGVRRS